MDDPLLEKLNALVEAHDQSPGDHVLFGVNPIRFTVLELRQLARRLNASPAVPPQLSVPEPDPDRPLSRENGDLASPRESARRR